MADQSVNVANFPDSGSPERVAFNLMDRIMFRDKDEQYKTKDEIINLYVDCLWATKSRERDGGR